MLGCQASPLKTIVGRTIIDNDSAEPIRGVVLIDNAQYCLRYGSALVVHRNNNGDLGFNRCGRHLETLREDSAQEISQNVPIEENQEYKHRCGQYEQEITPSDFCRMQESCSPG